MNRISKKDFIQYPNRYIVEGTFILTLYGKDEYEVTIKKVTNNTFTKVTTFNEKVTTIDKVTNNPPIKVTNTPEVVTNNQKVTNKVTTLPGTKEDKLKTARLIPNIKTAEEIRKEKEHRMAHYGCGCKKTDESLCGKHERR